MNINASKLAVEVWSAVEDAFLSIIAAAREELKQTAEPKESDLAPAQRSFKSQIASAVQELVQLAEHQHLLEHLHVERKELANCCPRVYDQCQQFTLEEKRQALEALEIRVT